LGRVFGRPPEIAFDAPRNGDIRESLGDPALAERALGFKAQVSLEDGLRLMAEYATSRN
jgi:nucleoside-diphosphate-sugar epimerase